jgi:cyanophycin synthetase
MTPSFLKLQRTALRVQKLFVDWAGLSGQVYFEHRVAEYRRIWRAVTAAKGGTFTELADDLWEIRVGDARVRILNHELEFDNPVTLGLAGRKSVVHRLLCGAGLAVPEHAVFSLATIDDACRFLSGHPRGCVVKPSGGYGGKGVTTHVQTPAEVRRAAILASLYDAELLIEAQIPGECYRLLVLEGKVIHAVCRRGPRAQATGGATVRQLIEEENARRTRAGTAALTIDRDCLFTLGCQDLTLDSTPAAGRDVLLKTVNDTSRQYTEVRTVYTQAATDLVCASIRRDAEAAAQIVGSDFLGVDVITPDPAVPLARSGGVINEVNTTPALHHHYDVSREAYPQSALPVLEALLRRAVAADACAQTEWTR